MNNSITEPLAPIVLFCYKRLDTLMQTIEKLQLCKLAQESELIIFSDGSKGVQDEKQVASVRQYLKQINGFKSITIHETKKNKGLATSIISGVSSVFNNYGSIIVLEDDIVVSNNFLIFMNKSLKEYESCDKIFSIAGFTIPIKRPLNYKEDVFFFSRAESQAWASWKNRWTEIDWDVKDYNLFKKDKKAQRKFNKGGADLSNMLKKQMNGIINSWAIRWCYHQFKNDQLTVYPVVSKSQNIGYGIGASNTNVYNRNYTPIDIELKTDFLFPPTIEINKEFEKQFQNFYSLKSRGIGKLYTVLYKLGIIKNKF